MKETGEAAEETDDFLSGKRGNRRLLKGYFLNERFSSRESGRAEVRQTEIVFFGNEERKKLRSRSSGKKGDCLSTGMRDLHRSCAIRRQLRQKSRVEEEKGS